MDKLTPIEHANNARRLIENVGGLAKAARLCRVSEGVLSTYQNPNMPASNMPADVISDLQVAGGTSLYSDALSAEVDAPQTVVADPMRHGCAMMKEATAALVEIHAAMADGVISGNEFQRINAELNDLEEQIAIVRAAVRGVHLRSVS